MEETGVPRGNRGILGFIGFIWYPEETTDLQEGMFPFMLSFSGFEFSIILHIHLYLLVELQFLAIHIAVHHYSSLQLCFFYLKVKEIGLHTAYLYQQQVRAYIRELMALPHLPANHIIPAFQQLKERCPRTNEKLLDLLPYFDENWVNSTSRPPASWSIFKHMVRTNDDVEGWHYSE